MRQLRRAVVAFVASLCLVALALGADPRALLDGPGIDNMLGVLRGFARPDASAGTLARIAGRRRTRRDSGYQ